MLHLQALVPWNMCTMYQSLAMFQTLQATEIGGTKKIRTTCNWYGNLGRWNEQIATAGSVGLRWSAAFDREAVLVSFGLRS